MLYFFLSFFQFGCDDKCDKIWNKLLNVKLIRIDWNCGWFVPHQSQSSTFRTNLCSTLTMLPLWYTVQIPENLSDREKKKVENLSLFSSVVLFYCVQIKNRDQIICISQRKHVAPLHSQFISVVVVVVFSLAFFLRSVCHFCFRFSVWTETVKLFGWELNCVQHFCVHPIIKMVRFVNEFVLMGLMSMWVNSRLTCAYAYKYTLEI